MTLVAVHTLFGSLRSVPAPTITASATARSSARTKRSAAWLALTCCAPSMPGTSYETTPSSVLTKFAKTNGERSGKRSGPP